MLNDIKIINWEKLLIGKKIGIGHLSQILKDIKIIIWTIRNLIYPPSDIIE
jgi:hypothetical protein